MGRHVELIGGLTLLQPQQSIVPQPSPALPYRWVVHNTPLREIYNIIGEIDGGGGLTDRVWRPS